MDLHAQTLRSLGQTPGEFGGVDVRGSGGGEEPRAEQRRRRLRRERITGEVLGVPVAGVGRGRLFQPAELVRLGGDGEDAGLLPFRVDAVAGERRIERLEVLGLERGDLGDLVGEVQFAVLGAVGEARLHEPAVATARRPRDALALQKDDPALRVALLGDQRGPQTAVAAADHDQIGLAIAAQRRPGRGPRGVVEPEGPGGGIRQRSIHDRPRGAQVVAVGGGDGHACSSGSTGYGSRYAVMTAHRPGRRGCRPCGGGRARPTASSCRPSAGTRHRGRARCAAPHRPSRA